MTQNSSFKIFVGVFPPKNIASVGNIITIYQTSVIEYYPAKILDNRQIINESYEINDCENSILGCDENFIIPPPPDNCGPGGGVGPPGPRGPEGPEGPPGRDGVGGGAKVYCGALPPPVPPTPDTAINMGCLMNQRGYVVSFAQLNNQGGSSCGINLWNTINGSGNSGRLGIQFYWRVNTGSTGGPSLGYYDPLHNNGVGRPGAVIGGISNECNTLDSIPKFETLFRKVSADTYTQEWTFEQFILMQSRQQVDPQSLPRQTLKSMAATSDNASANISAFCRFPYTFIPTGPTWSSGNNYSFRDWVNIVGGNSSSETAQNILEQNPECAPPAPPAPPLPTQQGASICNGGQVSGSSSSCGSCPPGTSTPNNCNGVKAGDMFLDTTNGVMYFSTQDNSFSSNGVAIAGKSACNQDTGGGGSGGGGGCIDGCGGGGGGGTTVPQPTGPYVGVEGSLGSTAASSPTLSIQVKSGLNVDFGAISSGTQIQIAAHSKAIGYIKLVGYTWDPVNELWLYTGYPQIFMNDENFVLSANRNWSVETLQVYNIAELDSSIKSIPLFAELNKINNIVYGFNLPKTTPLVSITYASDRIVPLYHTKNQNGDVWFINQANQITSGIRLKAQITENTDRFNSERATWKYTATFCKINYTPSNPFGINIIPTPYLGESSCSAYNLWELANAPGTAYGYAINSTYNNTIGGFPLQTTTGFGIKAVPLNTVVDLEVDENGNFYFNAINPIGGGC